MAKHELPAAKFKARCLPLLDEVAATGKPPVITMRGKPIVQVLPMWAPRSLFGAMRVSALAQTDLVSPTAKVWRADA